MNLELLIEWKDQSFLFLIQSWVYLCLIWPCIHRYLASDWHLFKGQAGGCHVASYDWSPHFLHKDRPCFHNRKVFFKLGCRRRPLALFQDQLELPSPSKPKCNHQRSKHKTDLTSVSRGKYILNLVPYVAHMELLPVSLDIKCELDFLISRLFDHRIAV